MFFKPALTGALPMSFQWTHNGMVIPDATNRYLLKPDVLGSDAGSYELIVSNSFGLTTNQIFLSTVIAPVTYRTIGAWGGSVYNSDSDIAPGILNPTAIAAGDFHNLILQSDGTVVVCGDNNYNQTNVPPSATNITAIAAGFYFNLALRADQTIVA